MAAAGRSAWVRRIQAREAVALRDVRLRALRDSPSAFTRLAGEVEQEPLDYWLRWSGAGAQGEDELLLVVDTEPGGHPGAGAGRFVGLAAGAAHPVNTDAIMVLSVWIDPDYRGRGHIDALIEGLTSWARVTGRARLVLRVREGNQTAIKVYERFGFRVVEDGAPSGSGELLMQLLLR